MSDCPVVALVALIYVVPVMALLAIALKPPRWPGDEQTS